MSKWSGCVGFEVSSAETRPGVHTPQIVERKFKGDTLLNTRSLQPSENVAPTLRPNVKISIVADAEARDNFYAIRYATYMGKRWTVVTADATTYPRLYLTLGGLYHGPTPDGTV